MRRTPIALALLTALAAAGCTTEPPPLPDERAASERSKQRVRLKVTSPRDGKVTRAKAIRVRGRTARGARVRVNGRAAATPGRRFKARVRLRMGRNRVRVVARKAGFRPRRRTVTVVRQPRCHPGYRLACLKPRSPDYDCEGGSGDGPDYTGPVRVVGDDPYGLDRDGDGMGCED